MVSPNAMAPFVSRPADRCSLSRPRTSPVSTLTSWHGSRLSMRRNPDVSGIGHERLRLQLDPRLPASAFRNALQLFARGGEIALDGAWVRLSSHAARLTAKDEELWSAIAPLLGGPGRFRPPRVRDIAGFIVVTGEGDPACPEARCAARSRA